MNIILHEPEIPFNTGNVGRTCDATGSKLHLIKPLGFSVEDKYLKRSGMDYWKHLDVKYYENFEDFIIKNNNPKIFMATTKSKQLYTEVKYNENDFIMFGGESKGIPEEILVNYENTYIRIPMIKERRSLKISSSVALVLYEALRQNNFPSLVHDGDLHRLNWKN